MRIIFKRLSGLTLSLLFLFSSTTQAETVQQKKSAFFSLVYPLIEQENIAVLETRKKLHAMKQDTSNKQALSDSDTSLMNALMKKYKVTTKNRTQTQQLDQLLFQIDIIPPSLAMAQSANESAWGKSRFAKQANNYFGQWCFSKGCGIVPSQRSANSKHEVRRFENVQASVRSYIKNINTTRAYKKLRTLRHKLRKQQKKPNGKALAAGLIRYSSRGKEYIKEIRAMIRQNKLIKYDERFWQAVKTF